MHILFLTDNFPSQVNAPPGESAEITRRTNVDEVFESGNAQQLVDRVIRLKSDPDLYMRYRTQGPIAGQQYTRTDLAKRMVAILNKVQRRNR